MVGVSLAPLLSGSGKLFSKESWCWSPLFCSKGAFGVVSWTGWGLALHFVLTMLPARIMTVNDKETTKCTWFRNQRLMSLDFVEQNPDYYKTQPNKNWLWCHHMRLCSGSHIFFVPIIPLIIPFRDEARAVPQLKHGIWCRFRGTAPRALDIHHSYRFGNCS